MSWAWPLTWGPGCCKAGELESQLSVRTPALSTRIYAGGSAGLGWCILGKSFLPSTLLLSRSTCELGSPYSNDGKGSRWFPEILKPTTVGVRWWERANSFPQPDPVSLSLPDVCDGSQWADMHRGGQEQLILKVCQPTLLGYLVNDRTEDRTNTTTLFKSRLLLSLFLGPIKLWDTDGATGMRQWTVLT